MGSQEMPALDAYFVRIEKLLKEGTKPDKMDRELRDALLFYTADQVRKTNGDVRENRKELRMHRWLIAAVFVVIAAIHGVNLLPLLF